MPKVASIQVVQSSVSGYGVVTRRRFACGDIILEMDGITWRAPDPRNDDYSLWIERGVFYDLVDQSRYVNHSCAPNSFVDCGLSPNGEAWANLVALRDIESGEELTFDYEFSADLAIPCTCGAAQCRGWIVAENEQSALRARLGGAQ